VKEVIEEILEEEKKARERVAEAREKAKQIRMEADEKASVLLDETREKARQEAELLVREMEEKAIGARDRELAEASDSETNLWQTRKEDMKDIVHVLFQMALRGKMPSK